MIKSTFYLLLAAFILSCSNNSQPKNQESITFSDANGVSHSTVYIYRIGDCQYLSGEIGVGGQSGFLTHKGDCDNPIHKCKCK